MRTRHLLWLALLATACRDFDIPAVPPAPSVEDLAVAPLRVGPGATLTITFRAPGGGVTEVSVNGLPAQPVRADAVEQEWRYRVLGDEGELLNVVAAAGTGANRATATTQAFLDAQPPPAPDPARLVLDAQPPGRPDQLSGAAGCLGGSDTRTVLLALDPAARIVLTEAPAAADGSFGPLDLGDNAVSLLYVLAVDETGNRSAPTALANDVEGPRLVSTDTSPRLPRAGVPLTVALSTDEPLAAAPTVRLGSSGRTVLLDVRGEGSRWTAATALLDLPVGPATLLFEGTDLVGNPGRIELPVTVADPIQIDVGRVRLARVPTGWSVWGVAGAAPFPAQVEASLEQGGASRLCGMRLVASDGSFDPVFVATTLGATDGVRLKVFDDGGIALSEALIAVDLTPPVLTKVTLAPTVVGPTVPGEIRVEADEPIGLATVVTVDGHPAARAPGPESTSTLFTYSFAGTEQSGEVRVLLRDRAGNAAAPWVGALNLALTAPTTTFFDNGVAWAPPVEPPMDYLPPSSVQVTVVDAAGVAAATWSAVNVRTGGSWDGAGWVPVSPPLEHPITGGAISLSLDALIPSDERVELSVRAEDAVGNRSTRRVAVSRYATAKWVSLYPSYKGTTTPGVGIVMARVGEYGLSVIAALCQTGVSCLTPYNDGRLVSLYSKDGGNNWTEHDLGIPIVDGDPAVWSVAYDAAGEHGIVAGEGIFVRLGPEGAVEPAAPAPHPRAFSVVWDGATAWVATAGGIFRSGDAGATWSKVDVGADGVAFWALSAGAGHLVAVGESSAVVSSLDGGANWTVRTLTPAIDLAAVVVMPDGAVIVGGENLLKRSQNLTVWSDVDTGYGTEEFVVTNLRPSGMGPIARFEDSSWIYWSRLNPAGVWIDLWAASGDLWDLWDIDGWGTFGVGYEWSGEGAELCKHGQILFSPSGGG